MNPAAKIIFFFFKKNQLILKDKKYLDIKISEENSVMLFLIDLLLMSIFKIYQIHYHIKNKFKIDFKFYF